MISLHLTKQADLFSGRRNLIPQHMITQGCGPSIWQIPFGKSEVLKAKVPWAKNLMPQHISIHSQ